MQYTGLKDKNGVEIYEGDIIEYDKIGEVDSHYIGVICFDKSTWRVNWNGKNCIRKDLEFWSTKREIQVIGNIYENPELLEGVNIEELKFCKQALEKQVNYNIKEQYNNVGNMIVEEIKRGIRHNNGWIPVSERLPDDESVVLIFAKSKTIQDGTITIAGYCYCGFWFIQSSDDIRKLPLMYYDVIAWQPLPEHYKEDTNE